MLTAAMEAILDNTGGATRAPTVQGRIDEFKKTLQLNEAITEEIFLNKAAELGIENIPNIGVFYKLRNPLITEYGSPNMGNVPNTPLQPSKPATLNEGFSFGAVSGEEKEQPKEEPKKEEAPTRRPAVRSRMDAVLKPESVAEPVKVEAELVQETPTSDTPETEEVEVEVVETDSISVEVVEVVETVEAETPIATSEEQTPTLEGFQFGAPTKEVTPTHEEHQEKIPKTPTQEHTTQTEGKKTRRKATSVSEVDNLLKQLIDLVKSKDKVIAEQGKQIDKLTKEVEDLKGKLEQKSDQVQISASTLKALEEYNLGI